jgi:serine/threonine protein kinase
MVRGADRLRGRFEIIEEIGEGGFARVYRARETSTGQPVALKVLKDAFRSDGEVLERFRREVFAVASIDSPHVVGLRDFGISGEEFFIAMEYVEGPTLRDLLETYSWSRKDTQVVVGQIAQALAAAHRKNIVHRDLKPENVMLVPGPDDSRLVKVLDFGLAKLAELERNLGLAPLTRVGMCFGTPQYMSPELIYGKAVDASVDLFALGVIAYEMLAGARPWDGANPQEVMLAVAKQTPPRITKLDDASRLEAVNQFFLRALAKHKRDRPADATSFFDEFQVALFGDRVPANRPTTPAHQWSSLEDISRAPLRFPEGVYGGERTTVDVLAGMTSGLNTTPPRGSGAVPQATDLSGQRTIEMQAVRGPVTATRLNAVWLESLSALNSLPPVNATEDRAELPPAPPTAIAGAQPLKPDAATASEPHVQRRPSSAPVVGLVILFLALIAVAAGVGFYIGRGHS